VFTKEDMTNFPNKGDSPYSIMDDIIISAEGVQALLKNLKPNKAAGPDAIPPRVLQEMAADIAPALSKIYQCSLSSGVVPTDWLKQTSLLYSKKDPNNWRPTTDQLVSPVYAVK
jgi:hypothetical protein